MMRIFPASLFSGKYIRSPVVCGFWVRWFANRPLNRMVGWCMSVHLLWSKALQSRITFLPQPEHLQVCAVVPCSQGEFKELSTRRCGTRVVTCLSNTRFPPQDTLTPQKPKYITFTRMSVNRGELGWINKLLGARLELVRDHIDSPK